VLFCFHSSVVASAPTDDVHSCCTGFREGVELPGFFSRLGNPTLLPYWARYIWCILFNVEESIITYCCSLLSCNRSHTEIEKKQICSKKMYKMQLMYCKMLDFFFNKLRIRILFSCVELYQSHCFIKCCLWSGRNG